MSPHRKRRPQFVFDDNGVAKDMIAAITEERRNVAKECARMCEAWAENIERCGAYSRQIAVLKAVAVRIRKRFGIEEEEP